MEELIKQSFTWARIYPFKNYCQLKDKENHSPIVRNDIDVYEFGNGLSRKFDEKQFLMSPKKKNRKTKYFHCSKGDYSDHIIQINSGSKNKKNKDNSFVTTKDRHIRAHYANPFSEIILTTIQRTIVRNGDKLIIKLDIRHRRRDVNWIYFVEHRYNYVISINLLTGNFVLINANKTPKSKSSNFVKNSFKKLDEMIKTKSLFTIRGNYVNKNDHIYSDFERTFNDNEFAQSINNALEIDNSSSKGKDMFLLSFMDLFIKLKKIKVNNDYEKLLLGFYPTEKFLKKNNRKLIASILDSYNIKSKVTIKILHKQPTVCIVSLSKLCYLFGMNYQKYIGNINDERFNTSKTIKDKIKISREQILKLSKHNFYITDIEKENLVKLINNRDNLIEEDFMQLLYDHFNMILKIRDYNPELIMKSTTYDEFNDEHMELSKIIRAINKGWVIEYQFNQQMIDDVQIPIDLKINLGSEENPIYGTDMVGEIKFYPYILKREEDYIEEGSFMHHCVASYSDKEKSIIISVRTEDKMDRVTCEYDCQTGMLIQSRHFCNKEAPADIELAIEELSKKIKYYARRGMLHSTEKKKVPVIVNGKEVVPEIPQPILNEELFHNLANEVLPY